MLVLIVYDISDNMVRKRLGDYLRSKGFTRIQRSVFIGNPNPSLFKDVKRVLGSFIRSSTDVIHVFPITEYSVKYMEVYGNPLSEIKLYGREVTIYSPKVFEELAGDSAISS